jgi:DNA-binding winged helix-turn-helix (wHTH) protein/TolB-like protein/Tfp pilus assembly protein PilF
MTRQNGKIFEFGEFRLDVHERSLTKNGEIVAVTPKVFDLLVALVENRGSLMAKDELIERLWPDSFVEEANLNVNISALRRALGERPEDHRFVETVPRRGYRFVADVRTTASEAESGVEEATAPAERHSYPAKRFGGIVVLAAFILISLGLTLGAWKIGILSGDQAEVRTLAVLPFRPLTVGEENAALEMGMADALITRLGGLGQITVRPTSAISKYISDQTDPIAAGREQQVDAVLDGKVQRADNRIRVTVQLLRISDGAILWTASYDDFFTNIFAVQDSISEKMASALALKLSGKEKELLTKRPTENTEAYALYLQGRYNHELLSEEGSRKALEFYQAAAAKAPDFALAYAWMVGAYVHLANLNIDRDNNRQAARDAAAAAVRIDPELPDAHEAMATVHSAIEWNWPAAEAEYRKAIELDPKNADVRYSYALNLCLYKRFDEALTQIETAKKLNPVAIYIQNEAGLILMRARRYDDAIAQANEMLQLRPDSKHAYMLLIRNYLYSGRYPEANDSLQKYLALQPANGPLYTAMVYSRTGRKPEADKILRSLIDRYKEGDNGIDHALYSAVLGDIDRVFEFLERSYQRRETILLSLAVEPEFDLIRSDPRYAPLVKKIGLPE